MLKIPVTFTHQGKTYSGYLHSVAGAGSNSVYHLMIDNFYYGRLRYSSKWVFDSSPGLDLSGLAEVFGEVVTT